jgi:hypothetical protein
MQVEYFKLFQADRKAPSSTIPFASAKCWGRCHAECAAVDIRLGFEPLWMHMHSWSDRCHPTWTVSSRHHMPACCAMGAGQQGQQQGAEQQDGQWPEGQPWWHLLEDFVPVEALPNGRDPRCGWEPAGNCLGLSLGICAHFLPVGTVMIRSHFLCFPYLCHAATTLLSLQSTRTLACFHLHLAAATSGHACSTSVLHKTGVVNPHVSAGTCPSPCPLQLPSVGIVITLFMLLLFMPCCSKPLVATPALLLQGWCPGACPLQPAVHCQCSSSSPSPSG